MTSASDPGLVLLLFVTIPFAFVYGARFVLAMIHKKTHYRLYDYRMKEEPIGFWFACIVYLSMFLLLATALAMIFFYRVLGIRLLG